MKFTPLKFQGTLAAAGIALMPHIYLKTTIFKSEDIDYSMLSVLSSSPLDYVIALFLVAVMGLFILIHFTMTAIFLKELVTWLIKTDGFNELLGNPLTNSALFSPLISLPMSMVVLFNPVTFFVPQLTVHMQSLMVPAFIIFSFLWVILLSLYIKVAKVIFTVSFESEKLTFGWLLDILALGAVSLLGAGIATLSKNSFISSSASFMIMLTLLAGIVVFSLKLTILLNQYFKSKEMPAINMLPAFFLVIPPMCLLGFSLFKLLGHAGKMYAFNVSAISSLVIVFSYLTAVGWLICSFVLLRGYFKTKFLSCDFSPAQWGMV